MKEQELKSIKRTLEKLIERIDESFKGNSEVSFNQMNKQEQTDYILDGLCDFWGIPRKALLNKSNAIANKRGYACVLLRDYINMTRTETARIMGYTNHSSVSTVLQKMDENLSSEPWGDSRMRAVYKNIKEYLNL